MTPGRRSLATLFRQELANTFFEMPVLSSLFWIVLIVAIVAAVRLRDGTAFTVIAVFGAYAAWRLARLYRFVAHGVEVDATLEDVDDTSSGETDFRLATYRYEFRGEPYRHIIAGADFFRGRATRHGRRVVLLVDPVDPKRAIFLRSNDAD